MNKVVLIIGDISEIQPGIITPDFISHEKRDTNTQVGIILSQTITSEKDLKEMIKKIDNLLIHQDIAAAKMAYYSFKKSLIEAFISGFIYTNEGEIQDDIGSISRRIFGKVDYPLDALWVHFCITKLHTLSQIKEVHEVFKTYPPESYCAKIDRFTGYSRF